MELLTRGAAGLAAASRTFGAGDLAAGPVETAGAPC